MQPFLLTSVLAAALAIGATVPLATARPASAAAVTRVLDEGMWPFDGLPLAKLKEKYGFEPTPAWLRKVRMASVRFDTGGSGSFVSPNGLVMTNHHVALTTLQKISTPEKDWVEDGFSARLFGSEPQGTDLTLRQLVEIRDVTEDIKKWRAADETEAGNEWRVRAEALTDRLSDKQKNIVADLVPLYDGEEYRVYVYKVYDDVRVVFAPEKQVAFYGGDLDNFTYPRYCLDCAFFRVYENGEPIDSSEHYFEWNEKGAEVDDLVFVSGHPGGTERLLTHAEMEFHRDVLAPRIVAFLTTIRTQLEDAMAQNPEAAFELRDRYFGVMNSLKAYTGHLDGLRDAEMLERIRQRDADRLAQADEPQLKAAFAEIGAAMARLRERFGGGAADPRQMMPAVQRVTEKDLAESKGVIARARFAAYGTDNYPDATFTLRLAFGTVTGYEAGTTAVAPFTTFYGLYNRHAGMGGKEPFDLPAHWLEKRDKLDLSTRYNFVCSADIIGGNSGSPVLNRDAEVVGLIFDGNIESLPGNYWFDERVNRAVSVHTGAITAALEHIYDEGALARELGGEARSGK